MTTNQRQFWKAVQKDRPKLLNYSRRIMSTLSFKEDPEDVLQTALVKASKYPNMIENFHPGDDCLDYLRTTIKQTVIDFHRAHRCRPTDYYSEMSEFDVVAEDEDILQKVHSDKLIQLISELAPTDPALPFFVKHVGLNQSASSIAREMNMNLATMKTSLRRIRLKIIHLFHSSPELQERIRD